VTALYPLGGGQGVAQGLAVGGAGPLQGVGDQTHGVEAQRGKSVFRGPTVLLFIGGDKIQHLRTGILPVGMGRKVHVVGHFGAGNGGHQLGVEPVPGNDRQRQAGFADLLDGQAGLVGDGGDEHGVGLGVRVFQPGDLGREVLVAHHEEVLHQNLGAQVFEPLLVEFGKGLGEIHRVVGPDHHLFGLELFDREVGDGKGLVVIAEGGHEHVVADPLRQHGVGGPRGHEGDALLLEQRGGRHDKGGVPVADPGRDALAEGFLGAGGGGFLVGFGVDADHFEHFAPQQPPARIDELGLQFGPVQRGGVDGGHAAGEVVEAADLDGVGRQGRHRKQERRSQYPDDQR